MKKLVVVFFVFTIFCSNSHALDVPLFNMPPNNYQVFIHKEQLQFKETLNTQKQININTNNISISGIFKSGERYFVLIDHKVYKRGDKVNGYTIVKIENNSVTFQKNGIESKKTLNASHNIILFTNDTISNDNSSKH